MTMPAERQKSKPAVRFSLTEQTLERCHYAQTIDGNGDA